MVEEKKTIYESNELTLISALLPTKNGMALHWKPWKPRYIELYEDATMVYRKAKGTPVKTEFNLTKVLVTSMAHSVTDEDNNTSNEKGITVKCTTNLGIETQFRCIFMGDELTRFTDAVKSVAKDYQVTTTKRSSYIPAAIDVEAELSPKSQPKKKGFAAFLPSFGRRNTVTQSIMRNTIAYQMDKYELMNTRERIIARRGELKWLPVLFSNDLVHGSWWFVIGSLIFMVSSIVMIANSNHTMGLDMGGDDSNLTPSDYRMTWGLMLLSGIFSTLGSMAFVRAVHVDPPMKPLFINWYHLQNDELLGSWLFLFAVIPAIPYCIIYLANDGYNSLIFLGGLVLACIFAFATFLFVRACYPSDKKGRSILKPLSRVICWCCCKRAWMRRHLANDWLAGTWFFLWASLPATIGAFVLFIDALALDSNLKIFLMGTTFVENLCFLIGSCYFVSGSYPEASLLVDADSDSKSSGSVDPENPQAVPHDDDNDVGGHVMLTTRVPNDIPYDEGDDSDEEEGKKYKVGEPSVIQDKNYSPTSNAKAGDTSPSIKNPLTYNL